MALACVFRVLWTVLAACCPQTRANAPPSSCGMNWQFGAEAEAARAICSSPRRLCSGAPELARPLCACARACARACAVALRLLCAPYHPAGQAYRASGHAPVLLTLTAPRAFTSVCSCPHTSTIKEALPDGLRCSSETGNLIMECCMEFLRMVSDEVCNVCV